ncbi:MAG TPA: ABC transporter permease [Pseudonocardiaceae bacterium]|nr:ABC transporter permease [Pseudonocardiaceae bacterium]
MSTSEVTEAPVATPTRRPRQRSRGRKIATRIVVWILRVLVLVVPIYLWQLAVDQGWVGTFVASSPKAIGTRFWEWVQDGTIVQQTGYTLYEAVIGYLLGVVIGALLAVLFTTNRKLARIYLPMMGTLNAVPRLALAPLLLTWLGLGSSSKIALVTVVVLFVNFFAVYNGLKQVSAENTMWVESLGASNLDVWVHVRIPSVLRWLFSSLRVSVGLAVGAAVVAEFVGAANGLGYLISSGANLFRTADVYAGLLVVVIVVAIIDSLLRLLERSLTQWSV